VGNYVGITIEGRFAIGNEIIRCISFNRDILADELRNQGYKVASFEGSMGNNQPIELLFIIEKRRKVSTLINLINKLDQTAIYSITDVKKVYDGPDSLNRHNFVSAALKQLRRR
jgi:uncharacterized protein YebE (UPF0316 family)